MYSNFQQFFNYKFTDIYNNVDDFINDYKNNGLPTLISDESATTLYYLLYARYGNSTLSNADTNQFKYKLFSIVWQYGGTWEKNLEIQKKLRELSLEDGSDIYKGGKAIYNNALNPGTSPSTNDLEELNFINSQNVTNYKKSKLDGLAFLSELLKTDVSNTFLNRFQKLFIQIPIGNTKYYITEEEN